MNIYDRLEELTPEQLREVFFEAEELTEREAYELFDEHLNVNCGVTNVCGLEYDTSDVFKCVDPVRYRQEFREWIGNNEETGVIEYNNQYYRAADLEQILDNLDAR